MKSNKLQKACEYQSGQLKKIAQNDKPSFHLCAPVGWINDPNGFSYYKGEHHLFYQYHPYDTNWGPMHWGHSKTKDFIKWEQLPVALAPDEEYDAWGCFSGSALSLEDKHVLMYTGVKEIQLEDGKKEIIQTQCIAIGDGIHYEKLEQNPVIDSDQIRKGSSKVDFRDPKIWKDGEAFFAIAGGRSSDNSGEIPLYTSKNLIDWQYCGLLDQCRQEYGMMWECPDFFSLDNQSVLICSPQDMEAKGLEYHSGNGTIYIIGSYKKENHQFIREAVGAIDYGLDFYAPQTMETEDGRRIMIAWMQSWDNYQTPSHFKWSGMMTIPRELHIANGKLYQNPIREIKQYYKNPVLYKDVNVNKSLVLDGIKGRELDMTIEIEEGNYESFSVKLASDDNYDTMLSYEVDKNIISFDRNHSGSRRDTIHSRSMYVRNQSGKIKIRIIMDKYSIEVFINDGEQAMTSLIYTPLTADHIVFGAEGDVLLHIEKYELN